MARVGARGVPIAQLVSLSEDLHTQALAVDRQLVTASRLPDGARHKALIGLKWRIMETEKLASRIRDLAVDMARPDFDDADAGIHHLRQRLDALDEARREAHGIGTGPLPDADERDDEGRQA